MRASSARTEQWIFTGGSPPKASTTSSFENFSASSMVRPLISSVAMLELAIAEPQPKVLKRASSMRPSLIRRLIFMMSPQAAAPTSPTPSASFRSPMFLGFMKWSMTVGL